MQLTHQERNRLSKSKPQPSGRPATDAPDESGQVPNDTGRGIGFSTISVHAGEDRQKPINSITDPVVMASTFTFENTQSIIDFIENDEDRGEYGRYGVPGEKVVERTVLA